MPEEERIGEGVWSPTEADTGSPTTVLAMLGDAGAVCVDGVCAMPQSPS
ncbi:hypothetical protein [Gordonia oryzae]|nr:hypothetical protein [Gordonia oryzae]